MGSSLLDELMRGQLRTIIRDEINDHDNQESIITNYMMEASFIPYFSGMLRRQVRYVVLDSIELITIGEVIENILFRELDDQVRHVLTDVYSSEAKKAGYNK